MFDVGFSELLLVGLVALLVIGPERLPRVAREVGLWLGKARRVVASVREEIKEELRAEELRQILKEQSGLDEVRRVAHEAEAAIEHAAGAAEDAPDPPRSNEAAQSSIARGQVGDEKE